MSRWPDTYCDEDIRRIAKAVGAPVVAVMRERAALNGAAAWLRLDVRSDARQASPADVRRRIQSLRNAGRRLSQALRTTDPDQADIARLVLAASIKFLPKRPDLTSIDGMFDALAHLDLLLAEAADLAKEARQPRQPHADLIQEWLEQMRPIYRRLTGLDIGTSYKQPPAGSGAGGPLIRFLEVAWPPVFKNLDDATRRKLEKSEQPSAEAWRARIRGMV